MRKTVFNQLYDIERRIREIRTLHSISKLGTKDAKLILEDLEAVHNSMLLRLPPEQKKLFLRNKELRR